jgi:hypothetical protein
MAVETAIRQASPATAGPGAGTLAPARAAAPRAATAVAAGAAQPAAARPTAPLKRGVADWGSRVQDDVARAQQALDYLDRVAGQLESLKGQLAARLSGARGDERQLEARVRELAAALGARRHGGGVDADLDFSGEPALQRFTIRGLDLESLQAGAPQALAFSIGGAGGPQLSVTIEAGLSGEQVAARIDRAVAPLGVHAQLDRRGRLVFSTGEGNYAAVKDSIAVSGRGRVATAPDAPAFDARSVDTGNPDALRQSLREVVQALARVRRAQQAASAALEQASARAAQATSSARAAEAARQAQAFADTASKPDYDSLLAMTSALVGVSRERVLALLGLR